MIATRTPLWSAAQAVQSCMVTTTARADLAATLQSRGFFVLDQWLPASMTDQLRSASASLLGRLGLPRRGGIRGPLCHDPSLMTLCEQAGMLELASNLLGQPAFVVRSILFDKPPEANWSVPWHQDTTIAVMARIDVPGFGPWSLKDEVLHVQPPAPVLERMVTLRISIDPCPETNGPLQVIPRTHMGGILAPDQVEAAVKHGPIEHCTTQEGGLVIMRPLTLHASTKAVRPEHRRVLHVELACEELHSGLKFMREL